VDGVAQRGLAIGQFLAPTSIQYSIILLPADRRLHVLSTPRSRSSRTRRRAAPQERRLHPGHPAGQPTQEYLARVVSRITLAGALFLGTSPWRPCSRGVLDRNLSGLAIGGTGLLIVRLGRRRDDEADRSASS
jgi:hypothetical protein